MRRYPIVKRYPRQNTACTRCGKAIQTCGYINQGRVPDGGDDCAECCGYESYVDFRADETKEKWFDIREVPVRERDQPHRVYGLIVDDSHLEDL